MPDAMQLPEVDFALIAARIAQMPILQRNRRADPFADGDEFVDFGRLQGRLRHASRRSASLCQLGPSADHKKMSASASASAYFSAGSLDA